MNRQLMTVSGHLDGAAFPGAGSVGNTIRARDHVPGSTLRGALASAWIEAGGAAPQADSSVRQDFLRVFESDGLFGDLRQGGTVAMPLSLLLHKYSDGSCSTALDAAELSAPPTHCPQCDGLLVAAKPDDSWGAGDLRRMSSTKVTLTDGEVAAEGQLYTREGIPAGVTLSALLVGDLADFTGIDRLWVGGRKTVAGLLSDVTFTAIDQATLVELRPRQTQVEDGWETVIYLASQAIFVDEWGRPTDRPQAWELAEALGTPARITRAWTRIDAIGGWHSMSGLPKPVEWVTSAGSVYVLRTDAEVAPDRLDALVLRGLGLRRSEGFGLVTASPAGRLTQEVADLDRAEREANEHDARARASWSRMTGALDVFRARPEAFRERLADECETRSESPSHEGLLEAMVASDKTPVTIREAARILLAEGPQAGWTRVAQALRGVA